MSLPEELEELELPPPQLEVPPALFEVRALAINRWKFCSLIGITCIFKEQDTPALRSIALQDIDISERISQAPKQRISIYCIAESLDRKLLEKRLEARGPSWLVSKYPDVLYGQYTSLENPTPTGVRFTLPFICVLRRLRVCAAAPFASIVMAV